MADERHVALIKEGPATWNQWRLQNERLVPDLRAADLSGAPLWTMDLSQADLRGVNLSRADLIGANLWKANLTEASLFGARLYEANLSHATLIRANLIGADLRGANLVSANLCDAVLDRCAIFGVSAWDVKLEGTRQSDLVITPSGEPTLTVDNVEIAQFIYLLLHNDKIRTVINTIGQKAVLILGRFTTERKAVLDAIRERLRELDFVPILFDFQKPSARDFTETIVTLAGMSRFIIADITNPKSSPLELAVTIPNYMIPFVPIIQEEEEPFSMFRDLTQKYDKWVLDVLKYDSPETLLRVFDRAVVRPALKRADELLAEKKAEAIRFRRASDYE